MDNDTEICCEWKHIAWDDHDRILQALIDNDQAAYNFLHGAIERQKEPEVLPMDRIAVIDYEAFAEHHKDIISFEALVIAGMLTETAKTTAACSTSSGVITMSVA